MGERMKKRRKKMDAAGGSFSYQKNFRKKILEAGRITVRLLHTVSIRH